MIRVGTIGVPSSHLHAVSGSKTEEADAQAADAHSHKEAAAEEATDSEAPEASAQDALETLGKSQVAMTNSAYSSGAAEAHDEEEPAPPRDVPKVASTAKDWEEISYHLAAKADSVTFKDTDVKSHIDHHLDDGVTLHAIADDARFTADERKFAEEKALGQDKYATIMNDMNRYWNFYGVNGQTDAAQAVAFGQHLEMLDGQAGVSDADRAMADAEAEAQGIELRELGPKGHAHPPAPPETKPGEVLMEDVLKTFRNIDKLNTGVVSEADAQKLVDGNQKMVDLMAKASGLGLKETDPVLKSGIEDLDKKAKKNVSTGQFFINNFDRLSMSDDNLNSLSVTDIKAPNKDGDLILTPAEVKSQALGNVSRIGDRLDGVAEGLGQTRRGNGGGQARRRNVAASRQAQPFQRPASNASQPAAAGSGTQSNGAQQNGAQTNAAVSPFTLLQNLLSLFQSFLAMFAAG